MVTRRNGHTVYGNFNFRTAPGFHRSQIAAVAWLNCSAGCCACMRPFYQGNPDRATGRRVAARLGAARLYARSCLSVLLHSSGCVIRIVLIYAARCVSCSRRFVYPLAANCAAMRAAKLRLIRVNEHADRARISSRILHGRFPPFRQPRLPFSRSTLLHVGYVSASRGLYSRSRPPAIRVHAFWVVRDYKSRKRRRDEIDELIREEK